MNGNLIIAHTAIAVLGVVLIIVVLKIEALIALTVGALYLGLATGRGMIGTVETIASGFGEIMTDVGLLIAFGVLLGSLLAVTGALERLTEALLRVVSPQRCQYVFGASAGSVFSAIYGDVMLVLTTPLGRSIAKHSDRGLPAMGSAIALGPLVGTLMVVPGTAALAVAGLLDVQLGVMLLAGALLAIPTTLITLFLFTRLLGVRRFWDVDRDELSDHQFPETLPESHPRRVLPLTLLMVPFLIAIALIALGGIIRATGHKWAITAFFGNGIIALFIALLVAYYLAWRSLDGDVVRAAFSKGMRDVGPILIVTGIGGSFGAVISKSGLGDVLKAFFSANSAFPILLVWAIAALLHVAIGSVSVGAITAVTIIAPLMSTIDTPVVLIALAATAGALFAVHVNSNYFWMYQRLMGVSTRGALKTCTITTSLASLVALGLIVTAGQFT